MRSPEVFDVTNRDTRTSARVDDCLTRGITLGYHPEAHEKAIQDVKTFFETTFIAN